MTAVVIGGACLLEESFNGTSGFTWSTWYTAPVQGTPGPYIYPNINGGILYFDSNDNFWEAAGSTQCGVETSDWALDLDHDFAFTVAWHNGAQNTTGGWEIWAAYVRVNCVLKTYGADLSEYPADGVALSLIKTNSGGAPIAYREWTHFGNGSIIDTALSVSNTDFQISSFVYYTDTDQLIVDGMTITGLRAAAGQYVELAFTAGNFYVASQAYNAVRVEDVCFTSGGFAGALTGACCMADSCVQGFASNCNGTFQGQGTTCDVLGACYDTECSGDFTMDGVVNADDIVAVVDSWSGSCVPCAGDGTTSGIAGVGDLIVILRSWGTCS